ncbi:hypothetical protein FRB99_007556 [Tulasnella sp. 403]|nr:hypothetical protein FRB99_007556 [Tulasnella sp. 403]
MSMSSSSASGDEPLSYAERIARIRNYKASLPEVLGADTSGEPSAAQLNRIKFIQSVIEQRKRVDSKNLSTILNICSKDVKECIPDAHLWRADTTIRTPGVPRRPLPDSFFATDEELEELRARYIANLPPTSRLHGHELKRKNTRLAGSPAKKARSEATPPRGLEIHLGDPFGASGSGSGGPRQSALQSPSALYRTTPLSRKGVTPGLGSASSIPSAYPPKHIVEVVLPASKSPANKETKDTPEALDTLDGVSNGTGPSHPRFDPHFTEVMHLFMYSLAHTVFNVLHHQSFPEPSFNVNSTSTPRANTTTTPQAAPIPHTPTLDAKIVTPLSSPPSSQQAQLRQSNAAAPKTEPQTPPQPPISDLEIFLSQRSSGGLARIPTLDECLLASAAKRREAAKQKVAKIGANAKGKRKARVSSKLPPQFRSQESVIIDQGSQLSSQGQAALDTQATEMASSQLGLVPRSTDLPESITTASPILKLGTQSPEPHTQPGPLSEPPSPVSVVSSQGGQRMRHSSRPAGRLLLFQDLASSQPPRDNSESKIPVASSSSSVEKSRGEHAHTDDPDEVDVWRGGMNGYND